jgi:cytochrome c553
MMKKQIVITTMMLGLAITLSAEATQGYADAGKQKAVTVCAACHGADGNSVVPNFPKLAGQNEDYLKISLLRYRSKERTNAIMNGQAATLTDKEIADLAAYFASQKGLQVKY